jgi:membrane associated rhomboid family serine protease
MAQLLEAQDRRGPSGIAVVAAMAALMWVLELLDAVLGGDLDRHGIEPRDADGLVGIVTAPFLHAGFGHLIANTIPFLILGAVIAIGGALRVASVTAIVAVVGGLGTWLTGSGGSVHIGASGLVFGYAAYLIVRFWYSRSLLHLGAGIAVLVVWGGSLLVSLLPSPGISWQGHLFGAAGGVVAARMLHRRRDELAGGRGELRPSPR